MTKKRKATRKVVHKPEQPQLTYTQLQKVLKLILTFKKYTAKYKKNELGHVVGVDDQKENI